MKILALEKEIPETTPEQFAPHLKAEAASAGLLNPYYPKISGVTPLIFGIFLRTS